MGFRGLARLYPSTAIIISSVLFWGCNEEEPSFTQTAVSRPANSSDATGELNPEDDNNPYWADADLEENGTNGGEDGSYDGEANGDEENSGEGSEGGGGDGGGSDGGGSDGGGSDGGGSDGGGDGGGGSGGEPPINLNLITIELTQKSPGMVDILWVIDSSGSMSEEQAYLGDNFNSLITELDSSGHDFQVAVTSTDVCENTAPPNLADRRCPSGYGGNTSTHLRGDFVGSKGSQVLKAGDSDLVSKFNQYTSVGTTGSGFEHGLYGAKMALDKIASGSNDNLLRSDAFLAVIVVSDEEDDGIGLSKVDGYNGNNFFEQGLTEFIYTEDNFITDIKAVKGNMFSVSAITGIREGGALCSSQHSQPREEGTQYIKAAEKTGGIIQSICDSDWSTSLAEIGLDLTAQTTQIELVKTPDVATIKVWVDGSVTANWTYSAGTNTVKFNNNAVPNPGQQIKVEFYEL
jgi:hypothetical protein